MIVFQVIMVTVMLLMILFTVAIMISGWWKG
jgi:hypothetical protein